jgi:hypothetical protein
VWSSEIPCSFPSDPLWGRNAVSRDAQTMLSVKECAVGIWQRRNYTVAMEVQILAVIDCIN